MSQRHRSIPFSSLFMSYLIVPGVVSTTFTMTNKCEYTVWPGILSNAGVATLNPTGLNLQHGGTKTITAPSSWAGRIWGRTSCSQNSTTGTFSCVTGDCGSGQLECSGNGATPPATLAEFTLNGDGGQDYYNVSLVDGYNLPMLVTPQGGSGQNCITTGCVVDRNDLCSSELQVTSEEGGGSIAYKSTFEGFQQPQYCCSGEYNSPTACKRSSYSQIFKSKCPDSHSYAFDDKNSTFTCSSSPDYLITFCPSPSTSQKASQGQSTHASSTGVNSRINTVVYESQSVDFMVSNQEIKSNQIEITVSVESFGFKISVRFFIF